MVLDEGVIHDHEPIYCVLESTKIVQSSAKPSTHRPRPSWRMAGQAKKGQYKYLLDTELGAFMFPTQLSECQGTHYKREDHLEAVNWFAVEMIEAVEIALAFPKTGKAGEKVMPSFCERVKPVKETLYFWHSVW